MFVTSDRSNFKFQHLIFKPGNANGQKKFWICLKIFEIIKQKLHR